MTSLVLVDDDLGTCHLDLAPWALVKWDLERQHLPTRCPDRAGPALAAADVRADNQSTWSLPDGKNSGFKRYISKMAVF